MATPAVRIYDALRPMLGDGPTKEFMEGLDESIAAKIELMKQDLVTKSDFAALKEDFNGLKEDFNGLKEDFNGLREEFHDLRTEMQSLKQEFKGSSDNMKLYVRAEIFRTIAIVGFVQVLAIIASVVAIIRTMVPH